MPTIENRAGNFANLRTASGQPIPIYDPTTTVGRDRSTFTGNIIPAVRFDSVARAALGYYPLPNQAGRANGANNHAGIG